MSYYQFQQSSFKRTKKENQTSHSKQRCEERMGFSIKAADLKRIVHLIQTGRSSRMEKKTNRITYHKVELGGIIFNVAYDKHRKQIATILPLEDF